MEPTKPSKVHLSDARGLELAAQVITRGGTVAVPTETVYGLAARADDDAAVAGIYRAKGRPDFNPLIVHVSAIAAVVMMRPAVMPAASMPRWTRCGPAYPMRCAIRAL